jgi:hypothetical protein
MIHNLKSIIQEFAAKSNFWFKTQQDMEVDTQVTNGTETKVKNLR